MARADTPTVMELACVAPHRAAELDAFGVHAPDVSMAPIKAASRMTELLRRLAKAEEGRDDRSRS